MRAVLAVALVAALLWAPEAGAAPTRAVEAPPREVVPGEWLVTLAPGGTVQSLTGGLTGGLLGRLLDVQRLSARVARVRVPVAIESLVVRRLGALAGVVAVEPNRLLSYDRIPDDELYDDQWSHQLADTETAWEVETGTARVTVGILDSGVDARHSELGNVVLQADASSGTVHTGKPDNDACRIGHGTMVAGVAGASGNNGEGVAGVNWQVSLIDVALSSPEAGCHGPSDASVVAALDYVTNGLDQPVDVVNMSFGAPDDACPVAYQTAIDAARNAGVVLVAASGNEETTAGLEGKSQVPASCAGVISVGATGSDGEIAPYSTTNPSVDLTAPGGDRSDGDNRASLVLTTARDDGYTAVEGSSFASPYVAGIAALLRAVNAELSADQVEALIEDTAADQGAPGRDPVYGWGLVQAGPALERAAAGERPTPEPDPHFPIRSDGSPVFSPVSTGAATPSDP